MKSAWLLLLLLPGGSLIAVAVWAGKKWRNRFAKDRDLIDGAITKQRDGLYYTYVGHDESLDVTARVRRDIADRKRRQAAVVTSGVTSADLREIARRA